MSAYLVTDTELTETANAIRAKTGDSSLIEWANGTGFANAVAAIPSGGGGHNLPAEYQEVSYIESTGSQYIATGVMTSTTGIVEIDAESEFTFGLVFNSGGLKEYSGGLFGGRVSSSNSNFSFNNGAAYDYIGNGSRFLEGVRNPYRNKGHLVYSNSYVSIECYQHSYSNNLNVTISSPREIFIFAFNDNGTPVYGTYRIYLLTMFVDNVKVREFIPCYRKLDSKPGMYDIVNNVFYTNSGTGEFIVGPDVWLDGRTVTP